jgi:hypothetical protein
MPEQTVILFYLFWVDAAFVGHRYRSIATKSVAALVDQ